MPKQRTLDKRAIGIIPSFDFDSELELRRWIPTDISAFLHKTDDVASREAISMVWALSQPELLIEPTRQLCRQGAGAVIYACTACSFMGGHEGERALRLTMLREGATTALTTSGAVVEAFRTLDAYRIAIAHPYVAEVGARLEHFINEAGFEVVSVAGLGLQPAEVNAVQLEDIGDIVRQIDQPDADLIFISCTALPTYDAIVTLERELGKPVVTANQATVWSVLQAIGVSAVGPGQTLLERR